MKKILTLCTAFVVALSALAALPTTPLRGAKAVGVEITSVDQIVEGKQYLLYDAVSTDRTRRCFRYVNVNTGSSTVCGSQKDDPTINESSPLTPNYLWELEKDADGNVAFKNAATGMYIPLSSNNGTASTSTNSGFWTLTYQTETSNGTGFSIKNPSANIFFNGNNGTNCTLAYWNNAHPHRLYEIVETDDTYEWYNGNWVLSASLKQVIRDAGNEVISWGDCLANLTFMPAEALPTWNAATATFRNIPLENLTDADVETVRTAYRTLLSYLNGKAVKFEHEANPGRYIAYRGTDNQLKLGEVTDTDQNIFTLRLDGDAYYLYNEYTNKYYKQNGANTCATLSATATTATATKFYFKPGYNNNGTTSTPNTVYIKQEGATSLTVVHANNKDGGDRIVPWNEGSSNSSWVMHLVDPLDAAKEHLKGAADEKQAEANSLIGLGTGKYCGNLIEIANNPPANLTADQLRAHATTLRSTNATAAANLNPVDKFRFYRFKCTSSNKYLTTQNGTAPKINTTGTTTRLLLTNQLAGNENTTILYIDQNNRIVTYPEGYVMCKLTTGQHNNGAWIYVRHDHAEASRNTVFSASNITTEKGSYLAKIDNSRYMYGADTNTPPSINAGGNPGANTGYSWTLEEVTELPVTCDAVTKLGSFFSPVQIDLSAGSVNATRFEAYAVEALNSGFAAMNKLTVIPANTPVILKQLTDSNILTVNYAPTTAAQPVANNALTGSPLAIAKPAVCLTLSTTAEANTLLPTTATEVPGFTAYCSATDAPAAGYKLSADGVVPGKYYIINNTEAGRGALIYDPAHPDLIWTTKKGNSQGTHDPSNPNHLWSIHIDANGNKYLYNVGAKKFATAFGCTTAGTSVTSNKADFFWGLCSVGTPVTMPEDPATNTRILGGETSQDRPAGMMIINGWTNPVPCVSGVGSDTDGNRFVFIPAANIATTTEVEELTAQATAQDDVVANAKLYPLGDMTDSESVAFGQYPASTQTTYEAAISAIPADAPLAKQYYLAGQAQTAAAATPRISFIADHVYDISDADGNGYHFEAVHNCESNVVTNAPVANADANFCNWNAEVNDQGQVTLYQNWAAGSYYYANKAGGRRNFAWQSPDATLFTVVLAPEAGQAYLRPVTTEPVALAADDDVLFSISHTSTSGGSITTGLTEVGTTTNSPCYDLQGRRLPRPSGLYIQNNRLHRRP